MAYWLLLLLVVKAILGILVYIKTPFHHNKLLNMILHFYFLKECSLDNEICFCTSDQAIFDFRFLALLAVGGSLAGSLLCFLNVSSLLGILFITKFHVT